MKDISTPILTKWKFISIYIIINIIGLFYSYYLVKDFYPTNPIFPDDFIIWIFISIEKSIINIVLLNIILIAFYIYLKF